MEHHKLPALPAEAHDIEIIDRPDGGLQLLFMKEAGHEPYEELVRVNVTKEALRTFAVEIQGLHHDWK